MRKLGFGCMRLPLAEAGNFKAVDIAEVERMVDTFLERGFTYFDTAYMYHDFHSECVVREALVERHPRSSFTLATKLPTMFLKAEGDQERIFAEQLSKCGVDYFDYYLLHNLNTANYRTVERFDSFAFAARMKAEGRIRHVGFSFHDSAETLDRILTEYPQLEAVQLQFNYVDYDDPAVQSRRCYEVCRKHGKPVIVMEPVKGGNLADLPEDAAAVLDALHGGTSASYAIRFAAGFQGILMVLSGMSDLRQVEDNIAFMRDFKPLDETELAAVKRVQEIFRSKSLIPCTACHYCTAGCPQHISIPDLFAVMNAKQIHRDWNADYYYDETYTKSGGRASDCIRCGKCEKVCPQHLHIRDLLADVAAEFEKKG